MNFGTEVAYCMYHRTGVNRVQVKEESESEKKEEKKSKIVSKFIPKKN